MHSYKNIFTCMCTCVCMHTHTHTHTCTHMLTHTHTYGCRHMHTHTDTQQSKAMRMIGTFAFWSPVTYIKSYIKKTKPRCIVSVLHSSTNTTPKIFFFFFLLLSPPPPPPPPLLLFPVKPSHILYKIPVITRLFLLLSDSASRSGIVSDLFRCYTTMLFSFSKASCQSAGLSHNQ